MIDTKILLLVCTVICAISAEAPYPARQVPRGRAFRLPSRQRASEDGYGEQPPSPEAQSTWSSYGPPQPANGYGPPEPSPSPSPTTSPASSRPTNRPSSSTTTKRPDTEPESTTQPESEDTTTTPRFSVVGKLRTNSRSNLRQNGNFGSKLEKLTSFPSQPQIRQQQQQQQQPQQLEQGSYFLLFPGNKLQQVVYVASPLGGQPGAFSARLRFQEVPYTPGQALSAPLYVLPALPYQFFPKF